MKNEIEKLQKKEDIRSTLSFLRKEIKESDKKEEVLKLLSGREELLTEQLFSEDAKTRKNAALLLGDLQMQNAKEALFSAYQNENTLFVKSSYVAALGKLQAEEYLDFFKDRLEQLKQETVSEQERKHRNEEIREITNFVIFEEGIDEHQFCGFKNPHEILLLTNSQQRETTLLEVKELGASIQRKAELHALGVKIFSKEIFPFAQLRTYRELLFPIAVKEKLQEVPKIAAQKLWESDFYSFLTECHKGSAQFTFRIEVKAKEPKVEFVKKLGAALEETSQWKLKNCTKNYEVEIRLIETKDGGFVPFLKLYTIPIKRFSYRKNAVSSSIHPSTAAMLVRLAKPYLKENAQILDPCCGVGTMLIERDICVCAREKYGIDIFGDAIEMARENAALAGEKINFIHKNYFDFTHGYLFDEIITNLPTRGKKSKQEMDEFYAEFFEKSKHILTEDGKMILYCNESGFVKKQLRLNPCYKLLQEHCIRKKDGFYLFIIGRK